MQNHFLELQNIFYFLFLSNFIKLYIFAVEAFLYLNMLSIMRNKIREFTYMYVNEISFVENYIHIYNVILYKTNLILIF